MYINVDTQEIANELWRISLDFKYDHHNGWTRYAPTNAEIDILFKDYKCLWFIENFYDNEPDYNEEEFLMYMDYVRRNHILGERLTGTGFFEAILMQGDKERQTKGHYAKQEHTEEEEEAAFDKKRKLRKDFEKKRIYFNNWVEMHEEGNWEPTQEAVENIAKISMQEVKKSPVHKRDRFWILKQDDKIRIYYYGRDYLEVDYIWSFEKSKKRAPLFIARALFIIMQFSLASRPISDVSHILP